MYYIQQYHGLHASKNLIYAKKVALSFNWSIVYTCLLLRRKLD